MIAVGVQFFFVYLFLFSFWHRASRYEHVMHAFCRSVNVRTLLSVLGLIYPGMVHCRNAMLLVRGLSLLCLIALVWFRSWTFCRSCLSMTSNLIWVCPVSMYCLSYAGACPYGKQICATLLSSNHIHSFSLAHLNGMGAGTRWIFVRILSLFCLRSLSHCGCTIGLICAVVVLLLWLPSSIFVTFINCDMISINVTFVSSGAMIFIFCATRNFVRPFQQ